MIRKVKANQLKIGMYVNELDCDWSDHPFLIGSFKIKDEKTLAKIHAVGIKYAFIDLEKGIDVSEPAKKKIVKQSQNIKQEKITEQPTKVKIPLQHTEEKVDGKSEVGKATAIYKDATFHKPIQIGDVPLLL